VLPDAVSVTDHDDSTVELLLSDWFSTLTLLLVVPDVVEVLL